MICVEVQRLVGLSHKNDFGKSCDSIFAMTWKSVWLHWLKELDFYHRNLRVMIIKWSIEEAVDGLMSHLWLLWWTQEVSWRWCQMKLVRLVLCVYLKTGVCSPAWRRNMITEILSKLSEVVLKFKKSLKSWCWPKIRVHHDWWPKTGRIALNDLMLLMSGCFWLTGAA